MNRSEAMRISRIKSPMVSAHQNFASSVLSETSNLLADSFILDSGAAEHVCNDFSRFVDKEAKDGKLQ
jgi:hypothetical protein